MSDQPVIPVLLGDLSNDLFLFCDEQAVVRETNQRARAKLGPQILGRSLVGLLATMARPKGNAFLAELRLLAPGACTQPWELLFHVPRATPLLASVQGVAWPSGGWLISASCDSPRLTNLYHEVLIINNELTNLVRQLSKEQSQLNTQLKRLLDGGSQPL